MPLSTRPPEGYAKQTGAGTLPTDVADGVGSINGRDPQFGAGGSGQLGAWEEAVLFELRGIHATLRALAAGQTVGFNHELRVTPPALSGATGPGPSGV